MSACDLGVCFQFEFEIFYAVLERGVVLITLQTINQVTSMSDICLLDIPLGGTNR
jgi:hypothetical protein